MPLAACEAGPAAAIVARIKGLAVNTQPMLTNTCYSFVSPGEVIHVASVHAYVAAEKTFKAVAGSGGVSAARSDSTWRFRISPTRGSKPKTITTTPITRA